MSFCLKSMQTRTGQCILISYNSCLTAQLQTYFEYLKILRTHRQQTKCDQAMSPAFSSGKLKSTHEPSIQVS